MNRLLLDEHFSEQIAVQLREQGFDVLAVCESPELIGPSDADLWQVAIGLERRIVTENAADFLPLLQQAYANQTPVVPLLLTTSRRFPRTRDGIGNLTTAIADWLRRSDPPKTTEEWLT
jgi:predicted nuclease of predicted toxin-antitoxin system